MNENIDWSVISRLRRELHNWSQADLMRASGLSKAAISIIEQRQRTDPYASTVYKLAMGLQISMDELFAAAGYEPTADWPQDITPSESHLVRLFRSLDAEGQWLLLNMTGVLVQTRAQSPSES